MSYISRKNCHDKNQHFSWAVARDGKTQYIQMNPNLTSSGGGGVILNLSWSGSFLSLKLIFLPLSEGTRNIYVDSDFLQSFEDIGKSL